MVLHNHQANPHVHLSVRAESKHGKRLNPRKTDLHRWRETFAEKLRGWGVEAEATRQASRGRLRPYEPLWRIKAREDGRVRRERPAAPTGPGSTQAVANAQQAWAEIAKALAASTDVRDRRLAQRVSQFVVSRGEVTSPRSGSTRLNPRRQDRHADGYA